MLPIYDYQYQQLLRIGLLVDAITLLNRKLRVSIISYLMTSIDILTLVK